MVSTLDILKHLNDQQVEYVLVGGMACVVHGSQMVTQDVDVCAPLTLENLQRICAALQDIHPRFRVSRDQRPLPQNPEELIMFQNLYLITDLGQLDILSEIEGIGKYLEVARHIIQIDLGGADIRVLDLDSLIIAKRAMNFPKDRYVALELSAIRERLLHPDKK